MSYGDPAMARQILLNLLDNAVKYGPRGQQVLVRLDLANEGRELWLSVADQGPGIPADARERIWEPYVRLPALSVAERDGVGARPHRTVEGGSGLGLAVVRELCVALGGRIWVEDAGGGQDGGVAVGGKSTEQGASAAGAGTGPGGTSKKSGARFVWVVPRLVSRSEGVGTAVAPDDDRAAPGGPPQFQDTSSPLSSPHPFVAPSPHSNARSLRNSRSTPR